MQMETLLFSGLFVSNTSRNRVRIEGTKGFISPPIDLEIDSITDITVGWILEIEKKSPYHVVNIGHVWSYVLLYDRN